MDYGIPDKKILARSTAAQVRRMLRILGFTVRMEETWAYIRDDHFTPEQSLRILQGARAEVKAMKAKRATS